MEYYALVLFSVGLLSIGLILIKGPFFIFALATTSLLDTMLDTQRSPEQKQKELISRLGRMLAWFSWLLMLLALILLVALLPLYLYMQSRSLNVGDLDTSSWRFFLAMIVGSFVLFVPALWQKKKDYSDWSIILHKLILDNYHVSRALFNLEKFFFRRKLNQENGEFVIVTGLARAGTTALTNMLYQSDRFHSLSYDNMPFLLAVNLWRKFYRPRNREFKDRAHGDQVRIGYDSIEALEEYFFKIFLNDRYIGEHALSPHEVDETTYEEYLNYQNLIRRNGADTLYLAKNNNFMLRYRSIRAHNAECKIILLFRKPYDQASSLLRQHVNFQEQQHENVFVLDYMNWLGHHEFGLNHKPFVFDDGAVDNPQNQAHDLASIDYWLSLWIDFYSYVLQQEEDANLILVDYADLLQKPEDLLGWLSVRTGVDLESVRAEPYERSEYEPMEMDPKLECAANAIYESLRERRITASSILDESMRD